MSMSIETLVSSIAGLSITLTNSRSLKILTEDKIPETARGLGQVMFPNPDGFISDMSLEQMSMGTGGSQKQNINYTMSWVFISTPVGAGRSLGANYDVLLADTMKIMNSFATNDKLSGAIDIQPSISDFGLITDPVGNSFYGAIFNLRVLEFYEA